jgi:hypothetical protein
LRIFKLIEIYGRVEMEVPPVEWKKAVSSRFPDLVVDLEISSTGLVRKVTTKKEFKHDQKDCYKCIKRQKKTIYLHTLVAETFLGLRPDGMVIDHIDGEKSNNTLANLRYTSVAENCKKGNKPLVTKEDGTVEVATRANARHFRENTVRGLDSLKEKTKLLQEENIIQQKMIEDAYRAINTLFMMVQCQSQKSPGVPS